MLTQTFSPNFKETNQPTNLRLLPKDKTKITSNHHHPLSFASRKSSKQQQHSPELQALEVFLMFPGPATHATSQESNNNNRITGCISIMNRVLGTGHRRASNGRRE